MTSWKCSNCGRWGTSLTCTGMTIYKGDLLCWDCNLKFREKKKTYKIVKA